eukprot:2507513-Amphidinium_carterae.1
MRVQLQQQAQSRQSLMQCEFVCQTQEGDVMALWQFSTHLGCEADVQNVCSWLLHTSIAGAMGLASLLIRAHAAMLPL